MTSAVAIIPLPYTTEDAIRVFGPDAQRTLLSAYEWMLLGRTLDGRMTALQRQGRVGFYGATTGHESLNVAAGLLTRPEDWIFPGLREQLVALVRGHPLSRYVHHLFATDLDPSRGRQLPCHPSAREVGYVSMSSVIGTQISHAVGVAAALRHRHAPGVALAFFGDGATSSNDFHAAMNWAGVRELPVLFCCANNQWAISVPVSRQSAAPSLAVKARAYGFEGFRVDGTDLFQVWSALGEALEAARQNRGPRLLEFELFRMTPHSTSDDPSRYQPAGWMERAVARDPLTRVALWLENAGWLDRSARAAMETRIDTSIRAAVEAAESTPPPPPASLMEDIYAQPLSLPADLGRDRTGE